MVQFNVEDGSYIRFNEQEAGIRRIAWEAAAEIVNPIIEQHGLEPYRAGPQNILVPGPVMMTKVDQHIEQIIRVADWLLGVND